MEYVAIPCRYATYFTLRSRSEMGFSIHYRSTDSMHPALAFEIKQHAERLIAHYAWLSCEPLSLRQQSDGYLIGQSKPSFFPAEADAHEASSQDLPDGTVVTLAEVLCLLSREHGIDWFLGHDYEPDWIGRISGGVADSQLIEQLETFGSIGDLLDESLDEFLEHELEESDSQWPTRVAAPNEDLALRIRDEDYDIDDAGPRVLKFPSIE